MYIRVCVKILLSFTVYYFNFVFILELKMINKIIEIYSQTNIIIVGHIILNIFKHQFFTIGIL